MDDPKGAALWLARMVLMAAGNMLVARGVVDAETASGIVGGILAIAGALWSWHARKAALAAPQPGVPGIVEEIERRARELTGRAP